jgi:acyl carrier protein
MESRCAAAQHADAIALLRDELLSFLADQGVELPAEDDAAPLLELGLLDSLALFNLALWMEERTGAPLDPTTFDVAQEWGSVRAILAFVSALL